MLKNIMDLITGINFPPSASPGFGMRYGCLYPKAASYRTRSFSFLKCVWNKSVAWTKMNIKCSSRGHRRWEMFFACTKMEARWEKILQPVITDQSNSQITRQTLSAQTLNLALGKPQKKIFFGSLFSNCFNWLMFHPVGFWLSEANSSLQTELASWLEDIHIFETHR